MEINVLKRGKDWMVRFNHGVQFFHLDYRVDTKEEAEWMAKQLNTCFERAFGKPETTSENSLHKHIVSGSLPVERLERAFMLLMELRNCIYEFEDLQYVDSELWNEIDEILDVGGNDR